MHKFINRVNPNSRQLRTTFTEYAISASLYVSDKLLHSELLV